MKKIHRLDVKSLSFRLTKSKEKKVLLLEILTVYFSHHYSLCCPGTNEAEQKSTADCDRAAQYGEKRVVCVTVEHWTKELFRELFNVTPLFCFATAKCLFSLVP